MRLLRALIMSRSAYSEHPDGRCRCIKVSHLQLMLPLTELIQLLLAILPSFQGETILRICGTLEVMHTMQY